MKEFIDKINKNTYLIFLLMLFKIWDIIKPLVYPINKYDYYSNYDWIGFSVQIITIALLYAVIKSYFKLRKELNEKIQIFSIISHVRNKRLFVKSFDGVQFFQLPGESVNEYYDRLPEHGLFKQHFMEEYSIVKKILIDKMKEKSILQIEELLSKYYPIKSK